MRAFRKILLLLGALFTQGSLTSAELPPVVRVGGLFLEDDSNLQEAFRQAMEAMNNRADILNETRLEFDVRYLEPENPYQLNKLACQVVQYGMLTFFGPADAETSSQLELTSERLGIPLLAVAPSQGTARERLTTRLFPSQRQLAAAVRDYTKELGWEEVGLLHHKSGTVAIEPLLEALGTQKTSVTVVNVEGDIRLSLAHLRLNNVRKIIVNVGMNLLPSFFSAMQATGLATESHGYLITLLDFHRMDVEPLRYLLTQFFGLKVSGTNGGKENMQLQEKLVVDAVEVLAHGLQMAAQNGVDLQPPRVDCEKEEEWESGINLYEAFQQVSIQGLSGPISFGKGERQSLELDLFRVNHVTARGLEKIGQWTETRARNTSGISIPDRSRLEPFALRNNSFVVLTVLEEPYVRRSEDGHFEGFLVDLMDEISESMGFSYTLNVGTGWNKTIEKVMRKEVDIGLASMTITSQRINLVDFSMPYDQIQVTVLYKDKESTDLGSFHSLLTCVSWRFLLLLLACYFLVAFFLFLVGLVSPYQHRHERGGVRCFGSGLSVCNSLWVAASCLFLRGPDLPVRSVSARLLVCVWWLFSLVVVLLLLSAQLAAPEPRVDSIRDLLRQKARFGVIRGGSTNKLIEVRNDLWPLLTNVQKNDGFYTSTSKGVERLLDGDLDALLMESSTAKFIASHRCDLRVLKEGIDRRSYGIVLPKGSVLTSLVSNAILRLQENGRIEHLRMKWWGRDLCGKDLPPESSSYLDIGNSYPLFIGLLALLVLCLVVSVIERIVSRHIFSAKLSTADLPDEK